MQEDIFPAAEKILSDIENVLKKDPNLFGFEIIPAVDNENKSPILHVENSLGLASWSVKPLYRYAYTRLLELRQNKHKREDPATVSRWLMGALLLNPDVSTFWNMRKELVKSGRLEPTSELHFVAVVLYYKAKCFDAFAYRRWLLQFILLGNTRTNVEALLENEVEVATMSADRYANNYHAWSHREYVVATFQTISPSNLGSFLKIEWENSGKWCSLHISDYSGFAYRQFLLKRLLVHKDGRVSSEIEAKAREVLLKFVKVAKFNNDSLSSKSSSNEVLDLLYDIRDDKKQLDQISSGWTLIGLSYWMDECMFNEELLNLYPGHEALWYHRRFLAHIFVVLTSSYKKYSSYKMEISNGYVKCGPASDTAKQRNECSRETPLEIVFRKRNHAVIEIAKTIGGHQNVMAERYLKFLSRLSLEQ